MKQSILSKAFTALTAVALVISQIILPIPVAMAAPGGTPPSGYQPVWCQYSAGWSAHLGGDNKNRYALTQIPAGATTSLEVFTNPTTVKDMVYAPDRSDSVLKDPLAFCLAQFATPKVTVATMCDNKATALGEGKIIVTITNTDDESDRTVTYGIYIDGVAKETVTLTDGEQTQKEYTGYTAGTYSVRITNSENPTGSITQTATVIDCVEMTIGTPVAPQPIDDCGLNNAYWQKPADTPSTVWTIVNGELIATAVAGYVFSDNTYVKNFGAAVDSGILCDAPTPTVGQTVICGPANNDIFTPQYDASIMTVSNPVWNGDSKTYVFSIIDQSTYQFTGGGFTHSVTVRDTHTECSLPAVPDQPDADVCEIALYGRTVRPIGSSDVTVREKYDGIGGEINADSFGEYYRLYAAADEDLRNVTLTFTAAQGMTFNASSVLNAKVLTATNMGALDDAGYIVAATGIGKPTLSADGKTITLTVENMPAMSAVALEVKYILDGSNNAMVVDSVMTGDVVGCSIKTTVQPMFDDMSCEVNDTTGYTIPEEDGFYFTVQVGNGLEIRRDAGTYTLDRINQLVTVRAYDMNGDFAGEWTHTYTIPTCTVGMGGIKPAAPAVQELPRTGSDTSYLTILGVAASLATYGAVLILQRRHA